MYLSQELSKPNQHIDMENANKPEEAKTIVWWKALLCALVILSFFAYMVLKNELNIILPTILAIPYYALCIWCFTLVAKKKIVLRERLNNIDRVETPSVKVNKAVTESKKNTPYTTRALLVYVGSISIGLIVIAVGLLFWWAEIRPVSIKKECSWVERISPAEPAYEGRTQEEADQRNLENSKLNALHCPDVKTDGESNVGFAIRKRGCYSVDMKAEAPRPAVPEKKYYESADKREYENCLRHNGF